MVKNDKYDGKDYGNFHIYIKVINTNKTYEIPITKVSISEEDLRVKSAKFSSYVELDLSANMYYVDIKYWNEKIYSGMILSIEYDEKTGIYSYQSLGHQRWLTSSTWFVFNPSTKTKDLYQALEEMVKKVKSETSIKSVSLLPKNKYLMYDNLLGVYKSIDEGEDLKKTLKSLKKNKEYDGYGWNVKDGLFYEDKTYYEIIMSIVSKSLFAIDCYVDENNTLRFDKINLDEWNKPNTVKFVLGNLKNYTFKSDATNIITGIYIKSSDIYKEHIVSPPDFYSSKDMIGSDLTMIYGQMNSFDKSETSIVTEITISETTSDDEKSDEEKKEEEQKSKEKKVNDVIKNERKARSQITKSLRDLMSFNIEINGYYPQLHTNMFIWFEIPKKHTLANYQKFMAKIDQTTTRGGTYVLNRFYVEKIETTYDDKGIVSKLTLNPFASDMSSYYKLYDEAINNYNQANCVSGNLVGDSANQSGDSYTGKSGKTNTPSQAKIAVPSGDVKSITVTGYPTTAGSTGGNSPYKYQKYTKTWANFCPICNRTGTLADNPKGVKDGEITCSKSKGGCDSDWDSVTGRSKAGKCPNPGCKYNDVFLVDTNLKRNSVGNISEEVGGTNNSSSGASGSTGSSTSCTTGTKGSYTVDSVVSKLADEITSAKEEVKICQDIQKGIKKNIKYACWAGFCKEPKEVVQLKKANCGDGTRTQLTMCAYKGVTLNKLKYVHIDGHYYGEYNGIAMDWCGGAKWNHHWGSGSLRGKSIFPNLPNANGCYKCQGCGSCGLGGLELEMEEEIYDYNDLQNYKTYLINTKNEIDFGLPILQNFNYLDYNKFNELGYKSHNQYLKENKDLEIIDFDDIEKHIRRCNNV